LVVQFVATGMTSMRTPAVWRPEVWPEAYDGNEDNGGVDITK